MKEDDLTTAIIERSRRAVEDKPSSLEIIPEKFYNNYGDRGYVDLFIREYDHSTGKDLPFSDRVIEVKGESGIQNATGANEIIRQFNSMCESFYLAVQGQYPVLNGVSEANGVGRGYGP